MAGKEVSHKTEERIIAAIQEMRQQSMSFRKIANVLTQMKVPTKCRGKHWHPEMVSRILGHRGGHL